MKNIIEIKAKNKDVAVARAIKILEIDKKAIKNITEERKPFSFLGLFSREGIYKIEIASDETEESVGHEVNKEREILQKGKELLEKMGLDLDAEIEKKDFRTYTLNLQGPDNGIIIGKKGKTLNSYEYLLNIMAKEAKIEVDVEGFKTKREETLRELAKKMSDKVLKTSKPVRLNPMSPRERKIIHEIINTYPELSTYSEGKDPRRYIVIRRKR